jgi:hypothetical protein
MTKNNILKMDYNKKKKDSFAYLMLSILKKKGGRGGVVCQVIT